MVVGARDRESFESQFGLEPPTRSELFDEIRWAVNVLTKGNRLTVSAIARKIELSSGNSPESDRKAVARALKKVNRGQWPTGRHSLQICWSLLFLSQDESLFQDELGLDKAQWNDRKKRISRKKEDRKTTRQESPINAKSKLFEDANSMTVLGFLSESFDEKIRSDKRFPDAIFNLAVSIHLEIVGAIQDVQEFDDDFFERPWKFIRDKQLIATELRLASAKSLRKLNGNNDYSALIRVLEGDFQQAESMEEILSSIGVTHHTKPTTE